MREKRRVITQLEVIKANDLFKTYLVKVADSDVYEYLNDYSDAKIAEEIDPGKTLSGASVGNLRLQIYGKLRPPRADRVEDIITQLQNVVRTLEELTLKHNRLCETLAINKIVDVRHLLMGKHEHK